MSAKGAMECADSLPQARRSGAEYRGTAKEPVNRSTTHGTAHGSTARVPWEMNVQVS